ncbi:hypothetical protein DFJ73DRAFT_940648 [Zopfochytrium polystomum]|nr:hypothetical protein DFJ73DRAFT_940648 [Zopfochytrium polystomum]
MAHAMCLAIRLQLTITVVTAPEFMSKCAAMLESTNSTAGYMQAIPISLVNATKLQVLPGYYKVYGSSALPLDIPSSYQNTTASSVYTTWTIVPATSIATVTQVLTQTIETLIPTATLTTANVTVTVPVVSSTAVLSGNASTLYYITSSTASVQQIVTPVPILTSTNITTVTTTQMATVGTYSRNVSYTTVSGTLTMGVIPRISHPVETGEFTLKGRWFRYVLIAPDKRKAINQSIMESIADFIMYLILALPLAPLWIPVVIVDAFCSERRSLPMRVFYYLTLTSTRTLDPDSYRALRTDIVSRQGAQAMCSVHDSRCMLYDMATVFSRVFHRMYPQPAPGQDHRAYVIRCATQSGAFADTLVASAFTGMAYITTHQQYHLITDISHTSDTQSHSVMRYTEYELRLSAPVLRIPHHVFSAMDRVEYGKQGYAVFVQENGEVVSCRMRQRTLDGRSECKITQSAVSVAPGFSLCTSTEWQIRASVFKRLSRRNATGYYQVRVTEWTMRHGDWVLRVRRYAPGELMAGEIEYTAKHDAATVANMPRMVQEIIMCMFLVSLPVYDQRILPDGNYVYLSKADDGGHIWVVCRWNRELTVVGLMPNPSHSVYSATPDVMHCELMLDASLVFICDVAVGGNVLPVHRPYEQYPANHLTIQLPVPFIIRRCYYDLETAIMCAADELLSSDGVVAIDMGTSITYRIKNLTIDMLVKGDALTVSGGYGPDIRYQAQRSMLDGHVYECEFELGPARSLHLVKHHYRPDKRRPNTLTVANSAIDAFVHGPDLQLAMSRKLTDLCFRVRESVYERAANVNPISHVIVDVGSGRMQCVDIVSRLQLKCLYCDPELDTHKLARRKYRMLNTAEPGHVISALEALTKGHTPAYCYRGRFEDLVADSDVVHYMISKQIPLVFSYSFSDIAATGVPVVGCCYLYDEVDHDGVVFDCFGITMRLYSCPGYADACVEAHVRI